MDDWHIKPAAETSALAGTDRDRRPRDVAVRGARSL